ncbi:hypothetical protein CABS01_16538 [Colletotrichum abscissum]|uniref:uncharacterized protein n=1 Tax=Colletotrichum abscissum TaxID=1671311 RepID=UPI0027D5E8E1|nr:uncharacterized protein CABS01_16538 [Colletotrichum abscissum]KAK1521562.1 hypothetical protein CABS01_16538 [Colletotrichum abscissum]
MSLPLPQTFSMFEKPKVAVMGLHKPLVMAVAVGLQTKMWGRDSVRQCEGQRVIKSYSKASIISFHSTSDRGRMYTVRTTLGPACEGRIKKTKAVCCQEEAIFDPYCTLLPPCLGQLT